MFVKGALDGEFSSTGGKEKGESADTVEVTVVALDAEPVEEGPCIASRGAGPEFFLPTGGGLQQGGGDLERMIEAGAEMATIDTDDDAELFAGRKFIQELGQRAAEPVEFPEFVPCGKFLDIGMKAAAEKRDEAEIGFIF